MDGEQIVDADAPGEVDAYLLGHLRYVPGVIADEVDHGAKRAWAPRQACHTHEFVGLRPAGRHPSAQGRQAFTHLDHQAVVARIAALVAW